MAHVVALYRYPVKGFSPEECGSLTVLTGGRVAGDRVLGVRFADTGEPDNAWSRKSGMLALINTPGLARLTIEFDERASRLRLSLANVFWLMKCCIRRAENGSAPCCPIMC